MGLAISCLDTVGVVAVGENEVGTSDDRILEGESAVGEDTREDSGNRFLTSLMSFGLALSPRASPKGFVPLRLRLGLGLPLGLSRPSYCRTGVGL